MRTALLVTGFAFVLLFAALTIVVAANNGVTGVTVMAVGILILIGMGLLGALMNPPPDE